MMVREFYDVKKRELLWKIFKLQMRNSRNNVVYNAFNTQTCIDAAKGKAVRK